MKINMDEAINELSGRIICAAIEVHRTLGPGLLESSYQACLSHELASAGIRHECEKDLHLTYKGIVLDQHYRLDIVVEDSIIEEIKAVNPLIPLHEASYSHTSN